MNGHTMWRVRAQAARASVARGGLFRSISLRHDADQAVRIEVHVTHTHRRSRAMRGHRVAFTLIELLVVIAIIGLLVSIMVPSLTMARELARRTVCAANLHSSGTALAMYGESGGAYPYVPLNGAGWGVAIGTSRTVDPANKAAQARSAAANLWLLARTNLCPAGIFVCPSTSEKADDSRADQFYDFTDGKKVSFSLQNPYGKANTFNDSSGTAILLADSSPYFDGATGLRNSRAAASLAATAGDSTVRSGNSANHRGDGQNVLAVGCSARFERRADCGAGRDNIYTRAATVDAGDPSGSVPAPAASGAGDDQGPASSQDTYLIP
ncbi:MAG: type II secretion system protein [Phycisphaerae bacterium]